MNKCEICNEQEGQTRLSDSTLICHKCYKTVWNELFKTDFNKSECISTLKFLREYNTYLNKYQQHIFKDTDLYTNIKDIEKELSFELFNKSRNCLKKREHLEIMKSIYETTELNIDNMIEGHNQFYVDTLIKDCEYLY